MHMIPFDVVAELAADPSNAWAIGTFGAIGEFMRDAGEPADIQSAGNSLHIVTARGAIRVMRTRLHGLAWDSLSADGHGWGHSLALCVPEMSSCCTGLTALGRDIEAIRPKDRESLLFDLGVGTGCVRMCVRTSDASLASILARLEGTSLLDSHELLGELLRAQPHRVMMSTAGRIEVFQPIPSPHGVSPTGPHTHLLPQLLKARRTHSANDPVPIDWQAALTLHPPAPWLGRKDQQFLDRRRDADFAPLLESYALVEDKRVEAEIIAAVASGVRPEFIRWPDERRARMKARITLRRLAASGDHRVDAWRAVHDHANRRLMVGGAC